MAKISFEKVPHKSPTPADKRTALMADPGFGRVFSDHMVTVQWTQGVGWHDAKVRAREPFQMDPAAAVLHYAQEIFEGMKAYRKPGGGFGLFRPDENARRFNESAKRMAMPDVPEEMFLEAIDQLVKVDADWVPSGEGSYYLRPFMFASEAFLGVRPANEYIFCVIGCPVGAYFKGGFKTVQVWVSEEYTRAAPGGTGAAKCGGNYASSLVATKEAFDNGCDQVVFLDAVERKWIDELGGMNIFFVMDDRSIITPPLNTILPGITRESVMKLASDAGYKVAETPYSFDQWQADARSGKLREAFACGTAAVIAGIGKVKYRGGEFAIGNSGDGEATTKLRAQLTGIQRGTVDDTYGWMRSVAA
ncbi:branched-chain-amino-acid aminotransferase [Variibacter gotjawalensis]|uniref:Branched-chain-amino-acid aminotransferase n=2 Tax=Variibacter gotjawalensis TaxID=1333996 RepID=A0A0S3PSD6_9BRAD|nr:branched-chain amino acid aminotransferase [Variibacter gotjawalensis]NIK49135.1 branched-chain amino acid aminotransferase [Variibacter gotjawalensis]RZS50991.1 branched-chain amino acid aminotransferase [Variibacter gotjawalensis]BAT58825.1 branched-chain-amino-acid aminotransferase [Variibacter gotjawalensis]